MGLPALKFNVNDQKTLQFQLREADGVTPVDITGLTFTLYARDEAGDTDYTIDPVEATNTDEPNGRFKFDITFPSTASDSLYWIERDDGAGNVDTFQPAEGTQIQIMNK
jgi:hypothetical protein